MKGSLLRKHEKNGFTLIEVIIAIIMSAIMGTIMFQILSKSLIGGVDSIIRVKEMQTLNLVMERITADYKANVKLDPPTDLDTFIAALDPANYGAAGVTMVTEGIYLDANGESTCAGNCSIWKVTLNQGNQSIVALFTE